MPYISTDRSNAAQAILIYTINLAALALLAGMLVYWSSVWFGAWDQTAHAQTGPRTAVQPVLGVGTSGSSANDLFGIAQREQNGATAASVTVHLLGVVADAGNRKGYAVLRVDEKQTLAVPQGEDIAPGILLAEVHPYHVILERHGLRETLALPEANSSMSSPVSPEPGITAALPLSQVGE